MINKSITFFFPYPYISGVPILFANITNYLLANTSIEVNIIDYKGGALIRTCNQHPNLNFIEFKDFEECHLDFDTYLVIQAGIPYKMRDELKVGSAVKIIQWVAFEYNLVPYMYQFNAFRQLQEKYFSLYLLFWYLDYKKAKMLSDWAKEMISRGSIAFMSKKMYDVTEKYLHFKEKVPITYLPLVSGGETSYTLDNIIRKQESIKDCLHLAWLGRIADFKVHILNYSIQLLSKLAKKNKINIHFHIIGNGDFTHLLNIDHSHEYFRITNVGVLEKNQSDAYFHEKIHALLAMGTSSIDGARVGLPVILLDYSYVPIVEDYVFRYLHHTLDYDLGHPMVAADFLKGNTSLEDMVNEIVHNYQELSSNSLNYYKSHHDAQRTVEKLLILLKNQSYFYSEIPIELRKISFFRKMYLWYLKNIKKGYYLPAKG